MKKPFYSSSSESSSVASSPRFKSDEIIEPPLTTVVSKVKSHSKTKAQALLSPAASFLAGFMTSPSTSNDNFIPLTTALPAEEDAVIDDYTIGITIGFGGFSIVHKAQHTLRPDDVVAVKIINQHLMNDIEKLRLNRELDIWKSLSHPRIIQLKKVIQTNRKCYILCDYCSEGNLLTYLNTRKKKLTEKEAKRIFKEICQAVYYLHIDRKVCHKDLKLENILLDHLLQVKLCDFGLAIYQRDQRKETEEAGGSLAYASPEQIKQEAPLNCPKTDIWSLGVILYALVVGSLPFMDTYDLRLQQKILEGQYRLPSDLSPSLQSLLQGCLAYHPKQRPSIDQVLNSSWLKK